MKGKNFFMEWITISVKLDREVCFVKFNRPDSKNAINEIMIDELGKVFEMYEKSCKVVVLEGNDDHFCFGADLNLISKDVADKKQNKQNPGRLYDLWNQMAHMSCVIISHVKGAVNAGGMGFISASDMVIAGTKATFGLSELLFGLMPAMVLPFLIRKVGFSKANYLTLTTRPIDGKTAYEWGVADICCEQSDIVLRQHVARTVRIPKSGIARYKEYINKISGISESIREKAIEANLKVFSDPINLERIYKFTEEGIYPWRIDNEEFSC